MANTPNVRFEGFTGEWEERKFGDVAQRISNTVLSSAEIPSVEYEDVIPEQGLLNKDIRQKRTIKSGIEFSGEEVLYGKLRPYLHNWLNPDFQGVAVGDWWVFKPIDADKNFVYRLIQTPQFDNIANQSSGTKMPRADWKLVSGMEIYIPIDWEEQKRIGDYFSYLDHIIIFHKRKCDERKELKKYMLQKMFPQNGKRTPEIRFAGFTDAWEQRKLGEIIITYSEKNPKDKKLPVLTSSRQGIQTQEEHFGRTQNHDTSEYNVIPKGYCTYRNRSDDKTFTFNINECVEKGIVSKFYPVFSVDGGNAKFLTTYLNSNKSVKNRLAVLAVGTSQVVLSLTQLKELKILLPTEEEQIKIGEYFDNLDHLITLHQRKHDQLKEVKKFMLQNMFPQKG